ncbi:MAG: hypothetical protein WDN67_04620 [Candidatus Moraniibacteriota bacterium]
MENITVSLYYVKHGVKLSSTRTQDQLREVESTFLQVIGDIEAEHFEPILSALCDWCGYQKICPLWRHKFKETRRILSEEAEKAIDEFLRLRDEMRQDKKRLAELQATLLAYMEEEEVERVFGEHGIVGKSIRSTYRYDPQVLRAVLEPLDKWEDVLKVDGILLRKIVQDLPAPVRKRIEEARTLDKQSTTLSIKKLGTAAEMDETVYE